MMKLSAFFSFLFAFFFITAPLLSQVDTDHEQFCDLIQEIEQINFVHGTKAYLLLNELYEISNDHPDSLRRVSWCLYMESLINASQGENDSSIQHRIIVHLQQLSKIAYPFESALLQYSLSLNYVIESNYAEAFASGLSALEQFQQLKDSLFMGKTLIELGTICSYIKSYKMSEEYFQKALTFTPSHQKDYYRIKRSLASLLYYTGRKQEAIDAILRIIPDVEQSRDTGVLVSTYMGVALSYSSAREHEKADHYYTILLHLIKQIDNNKAAIVLYNNLGVYYYNMQNFEKAKSYFDTTKMASLQAKNLISLSSAYIALSNIYALKGNIDSAYYYLNEYTLLNESISDNAKTIEAYQAYISVLLESSQKELNMAAQELQLKNRHLVMTIILSIMILLLAVLTFIIFQQKKRQQSLLKEAENKDLSERLKNEQKIKQLQEEQLESKVREIASYSLHLADKNKILEQIASLTEQSAKSQQEFEEVNERIKNIIKSNKTADHDWETFILHFDKVHPSFFDRLKLYCSTLTENNLRLCAYFRIGLSTKEIAQILNVSPETSRTIRYRLKKKLRLSEEENLEDFLRHV